MTCAQTIYVGMKIHGNTIDFAFAPGEGSGADRFYKTVAADMSDFSRTVEELTSLFQDLHFVYEAGACGYDYYRFLTEQGLTCQVVAPATRTRRSAKQTTAHYRDALQLARMQRAGELIPICVPHPEDEALRDLIRCCEAARHSRRRARRQVEEFLKRSSVHHSGGWTWSAEQFRWLKNLNFSLPAQQLAFQEYLDMVTVAGKRLKRLEQHLEEVSRTWRMRPLVEAYQTLRGINFLAAVTLAAELGDLRRFSNPRKVMAYVGLIPNKNFSGDRPHYNKNQGQNKNSLLANVLFEAAWAYSKPAGTTSMVTRLLTGQPRPIVEISRQAELRLCSSYREYISAGNSHEQALTKIARDLLPYAWSISQEIKFHQPTVQA